MGGLLEKGGSEWIWQANGVIGFDDEKGLGPCKTPAHKDGRSRGGSWSYRDAELWHAIDCNHALE